MRARRSDMVLRVSRVLGRRRRRYHAERVMLPSVQTCTVCTNFARGRARSAATATAAGTTRYGPEKASTTMTAAKATAAAARGARSSRRTPAAVAVTYTATNEALVAR